MTDIARRTGVTAGHLTSLWIVRDSGPALVDVGVAESNQQDGMQTSIEPPRSRHPRWSR
jgi:hypothetical protein